MEVFVGGGSSVSALAEANCWRWVDGKSIWKVLSKEAFGSVGGLELQVGCEAAVVCVCGEENTSVED
jgi:hypothetical protein